MFVADAHFIAEVENLINDWERLLYASESWDKNFDLASFRFLHTLKGSAALFGFAALAETAHVLESFFETAQAQHSLTQAEKGFFLSAVSHFRYLLHHEPLQGKDAESHAAFLQKVVYHKKGLHKKEIASYWIHYQPATKTAKVGIKPHLHLDDLQAIEAEIAIFDIATPQDAQNLAQGKAQEWVILISTKLKIEELRNIFLFLTNECKLDILPLTFEGVPHFNLFTYPQTRSFLQNYFQSPDKENQNPAALSDFSTFKKALSNFLTPYWQQTKTADAPTHDLEKTSPSLRLALSEIDALSQLVAQSLAALKVAQIEKAQENLILLQEKIKNWQYETPDKLKQKCDLLVRNLSQEGLKKGTLSQEARLDWHIEAQLRLHKTQIELLGEIFLHLIRNSFAHAFAFWAEKTTKPLISIHFETLKEGELIITYRDNGAGIDVEKIRQKALDTQLFSSAELENMDAERLVSLIFQDRFSTQAAEKLSHLAGRGIGMGIIKSQVEKMGGKYRLLVEKEGGFGLEIVLNI
ncbi:ATP-binding protein [Hugenholtzia roseola]|uniref:ATP-binding protein n=1 Tax=Hugenholtzia roseola TaxID=1002 RepID=UPI001378A649|nr:ATP-binding protein [Hugenholtzia roseola]